MLCSFIMTTNWMATQALQSAYLPIFPPSGTCVFWEKILSVCTVQCCTKSHLLIGIIRIIYLSLVRLTIRLFGKYHDLDIRSLLVDRMFMKTESLFYVVRGRIPQFDAE